MRVSATSAVGAILAGGASRRFGGVKGLAELGGRTLVERVADAHREVLAESVLVTDRPDLYREVGISTIPDRYPGAGPLAGLHAALEWAAERGARGICSTPCDAPFVSGAYLRLLVSVADRERAQAIVPENPGRLGYEPLFGWYATTLLPRFADALIEGETPVHRLLEGLDRLVLLPAARVREVTDPSLLFLNVNTPADLEQARLRWAAPAGAPAESGDDGTQA